MSSRVLPFADLTKKSKDLLTKDFPTDVKLEVKNKSESGVAFNATTTRSDAGAFKGELETKFTTSRGVTVTSKLDTSSINKVEFTTEPAPVVGGKLTVETVTKGGNADSVKTSLQIARESLNTTVGFDLIKKNITTSAVLGYEGWSVGADLEYRLSSRAITKSDFTAAFNGGDFVVAATSVESGKTMKLSYHQSLNKAFATGASVAGEYVVKRDTSAQSLTVGGQFNLDKQGTFVKAKFSTDGTLGLGFSTKVHSNVTLTVGSSLQTLSLKEADSQKVGFALAFSD